MSDAKLFDGLTALYEASFPKKCANCGRTFASAEDYTTQTEDVHGKSGLKSSLDDDDKPIVELFRNCPCGSTLMDCFADRRSPAAMKRRKVFGRVLDTLEQRGMERNHAREELLKVLRGGTSPEIEALGIQLGTRPPSANTSSGGP